MGKEKSPGKRYCEECGRLIESKRPGVTLCLICETQLLQGVRTEQNRQRRKDRKQVQEIEDQLFEPEALEIRPKRRDR